ncbi:HNH endonuclease [Candidatus Neomarinimicrobiota bacterium]
MMSSNQDLDNQIRLRAFEWLADQSAIHDDLLPRKLLEQGFMFGDHQIRLLGPQGIFKPKAMELPLTITTIPSGPYHDYQDAEGYLHYNYQGTNVDLPINAGLRELCKRHIPLIYLLKVLTGKYLATCPAYIINDDPANLVFTVDLDQQESIQAFGAQISEPIQQYRTSLVQTRLHQRSFRERVLHAYKTQCAVCRLKHKELLEASHIIPDSEPNSPLTVNNGLALCKLHHAAYDSLILGITPDSKVVIRGDILEEQDGPLLFYGLQNLHDSTLILPVATSDRPNKDYLDYRYQRFRNAL